MWKLLRNTLLVAVLLAGVCKLVLWYEIQQGAARLAAQLAPYAQLQYGGVSAGLKGEVELSAVTLTAGKDAARQVWRASSIELTTPGVLWLARRLLFANDSLPDHLVMTFHGLQAPPNALGPLAGWLSPLSLVPFESFGCGVVSHFSTADYQRMGLNPGAAIQRVEYRYDADASTLGFNADLRSPPFSTLTLHAELSHFDPRALASGAWGRLHVGELNAAYADGGYLGKRNRFCAQQAGIAPAQFVDQHVAAVLAFLSSHGIEPGADVTAMYRSLVADGGRVSILSLPIAASTLGQLLSQPAETTMRQMNLTARRNDAPPVMFRLSFKAPPEAPGTAASELAASAVPASAVAPATTTAIATAPTPPARPALAAAAPATPVAKAPVPAAVTAASAPPPSAAVRSPATAAATKPATTAAALPVAAEVRPPATSAAKPAATGAASVARGAPATTTATAPAPVHAEAAVPKTTPQTAAAAARTLDASAPPPPPGSTLALVWKPTVERLEEASPPPRDYDVLEYDALSGYSGRYVRLLTKTRKKVEGRIVGVDPTSVSLRIQNSGGTAELQVPRSVIVEIQLPHPRRPDD